MDWSIETSNAIEWMELVDDDADCQSYNIQDIL